MVTEEQFNNIRPHRSSCLFTSSLLPSQPFLWIFISSLPLVPCILSISLPYTYVYMYIYIYIYMYVCMYIYIIYLFLYLLVVSLSFSLSPHISALLACGLSLFTSPRNYLNSTPAVLGNNFTKGFSNTLNISVQFSPGNLSFLSNIISVIVLFWVKCVFL